MCGTSEDQGNRFSDAFRERGVIRRALYAGYAEGQESSSEALERCDHRRHGSYFLSGKVEGKTLKVALKCREA